jgi:hypothetical protein
MATTNDKWAVKRAEANPLLASCALSDFAELPEGIISSNTARGLEKVDVSHLRVPEWNKFNLRDFAFKFGYKRFVGTVDEVNKGTHVTRWQMEALWLRILKKKYASYDPRPNDLSRFQGTRFSLCMQDKEKIFWKAYCAVSNTHNNCVSILT